MYSHICACIFGPTQRSFIDVLNWTLFQLPLSSSPCTISCHPPSLFLHSPMCTTSQSWSCTAVLNIINLIYLWFINFFNLFIDWIFVFLCAIFFSLWVSVASTLKRCLCAFENLSDEPLVYDFELDLSFLLFGRRNDSFCCCILLVPLQHIFMVHCST